MSHEQDKIQNSGKNRFDEFRRDRQDEFLLDELRETLEKTRNNCDHNKETIGEWGHEDENQNCFLVERCEVCGEEMIVPDQEAGNEENRS